MAEIQTLHFRVTGRVQGVGFRPFVYSLASQLGLKGYVRNSQSAVEISVSGSVQNLQRFERSLTEHKPVQARVDGVEKTPQAENELEKYDEFHIIHSESNQCAQQGLANNQLAADIAVCANCLQEFHDSNSRRYLDPFINCSDCGPRYSIIQRLPYDRQHSAMQVYEKCPQCQQEYSDPSDRRYHTQGICCPQCGPQITLYDNQQQPLAEGVEAVQKVAQILKQQGLVAFKGVGGFHILANATDDTAVSKLRRRKQRPLKPLAVLCKDEASARSLGDFCQHELLLLNSDAKPIVLVNKCEHSSLSDLIAPGIDRLGLFVAYTPLQHLLFHFIDQPLVATSANLAGEPIIFETEHLFNKLCRPGLEIVDYVLDFDRAIVNPCDDSIVQSVNGKLQTLRMARGLAPLYGRADSIAKKSALAVGAQQKNSIAFADNQNWILSPYIGDLHNLASQQRFAQTVHNLQQLLSIQPHKVVADLHPGYGSSKWAEQWGQEKEDEGAAELDRVQHHYAHVLATMAEHNLQQQVLAFSWDGTGLGDDKTLWGGEVFLADQQAYQRCYHFRPVKLLGGDLANKQPKRVGLSWLFDLFSLAEVLAMKSPTVAAFSVKEIEQLHQMHQQNINSPLSSSVGRLFDAVASLLGLVQELSYEGQTGLLLESLYDPAIEESYDFQINQQQIDIEPMFKKLLADQQQGVQTSLMVSRFINMLVKLIESVSDLTPELSVVVSGGVFQNRTLLELVDRRLAQKQRPLLFQQQTPINDGGIALGQLYKAGLGRNEG